MANPSFSPLLQEQEEVFKTARLVLEVFGPGFSDSPRSLKENETKLYDKAIEVLTLQLTTSITYHKNG